ncbi:hypothetical protein LTS10_008536 [Elasticomyces elasticus]|nr:hypothetical protein LTS10_008536 [Elasticomyces elasticus]
MIGAEITANPLKLDVRSHWKCLAICFIATISTFQYGESCKSEESCHANDGTGLDYALVGGFLSMPGFLEVYGYYDPVREKWAIDVSCIDPLGVKAG